MFLQFHNFQNKKLIQHIFLPCCLHKLSKIFFILHQFYIINTHIKNSNCLIQCYQIEHIRNPPWCTLLLAASTSNLLLSRPSQQEFRVVRWPGYLFYWRFNARCVRQVNLGASSNAKRWKAFIICSSLGLSWYRSFYGFLGGLHFQERRSCFVLGAWLCSEAGT